MSEVIYNYNPITFYSEGIFYPGLFNDEGKTRIRNSSLFPTAIRLHFLFEDEPLYISHMSIIDGGQYNMILCTKSGAPIIRIASTHESDKKLSIKTITYISDMAGSVHWKTLIKSTHDKYISTAFRKKDNLDAVRSYISGASRYVSMHVGRMYEGFRREYRNNRNISRIDDSLEMQLLKDLVEGKDISFYRTHESIAEVYKTNIDRQEAAKLNNQHMAELANGDKWFVYYLAKYGVMVGLVNLDITQDKGDPVYKIDTKYPVRLYRTLDNIDDTIKADLLAAMALAKIRFEPIANKTYIDEDTKLMPVINDTHVDIHTGAYLVGQRFPNVMGLMLINRI